MNNNKHITHAMVLAAGMGLRMRPLSETTPKPLLKAGGKPMIDWALDSLHGAGVKVCVVNTHWLGEQIESHLKGNSSPAISFVSEDPILETGGGILNALDKKLLGDGAFYAINADQIWVDSETPALEHMAYVWDEEKMDALLLLQPLASAFGYDGVGDFNLAPGGAIERRHEGANAELVFTGVQILNPKLFTHTNTPSSGDAFSLNILYDNAIEQGRLFGVTHDGEWLHIGTPKALDDANIFLAEKGIKK
ncbi:MAG: nucleotidyltransferase family protein [Rhodospirillaceae bacterium]|nr:nucleotidyltransferase family protein [Rhodospirillaceae bacterium]